MDERTDWSVGGVGKQEDNKVAAGGHRRLSIIQSAGCVGAAEGSKSQETLRAVRAGLTPCTSCLCAVVRGEEMAFVCSLRFRFR